MIKKTFLILLITINFIVNSHAQSQKKIDSLSKRFHSEKIDSVKSRILLELSIAYYRTDFTKSKETADSLLRFSKDRSKKYYGLGLRMKGTLQLINGDYVSSKENYLKALNIFQEIQDYRHSGAIYENLGTYYGRKGAIDSSNIYYLKAIKLSDSIGNKKAKLNSLLNLGINSNRQFRYEESNDYYIKALAIAEEYNDKPNTVHVLSSLSNNYFELKKYDLAEDRLIKALSLAQQIESNFSLARINNSLGYLYENRDKDYKRALLFYEKSIDYNKKVGNKISLQTSYFNAGLQNIYLDRYNSAKSQINQGLKLADELHSIDGKIIGNFHLALINIKQGNLSASNRKLLLSDKMLQGKSRLKYRKNYLDIAEAYRDRNQFDKAYTNYKIYIELKDSLQEQNDVRKIVEIEQKYENQKKRNEILQLKNSKISDQLEIEKQQKRNGLLLFGLLLISILSYFFWRRFRVEKRIRQTVTKQKDEISKKK